MRIQRQTSTRKPIFWNRRRDRKIRNPRRLATTGLLLFALGLSSCASDSFVHEKNPKQLRYEIARDVPHLSPEQVVIPHEISP